MEPQEAGVVSRGLGVAETVHREEEEEVVGRQSLPVVVVGEAEVEVHLAERAESARLMIRMVKRMKVT